MIFNTFLMQNFNAKIIFDAKFHTNRNGVSESMIISSL